MSVAVDAVGPGAGLAAYSQETTTLSWTHDCGAEATYLLAAVTIDEGQPPYGVTCSYGGAAMTLLEQVASGDSNAGFITLFGLTNPAAGSHTVSVASLSDLADQNTGGSISFTGASGIGTIYTGYSGNDPDGYTSGSIEVPETTSGNLVAAFVGNGSSFPDGTPFESPATTEWAGDDSDLGPGAGASAHSGAAVSDSTGSAVTVSWTQIDDWWGAIAVELQAGTGGPSVSASGLLLVC